MEKEEQQSIALHEEALRGMIHTIRGVQVMLDKDLARLYEVKPIRLREQMKRNSNRFPEDFVFQLTGEGVDLLVSQNAIPSRKQLGGAFPYVFTEQGVAAISGVLTGDRAVEVNIAIMRAFVAMRRYLAENVGILHRLDSVERRQMIHEIRTNERFDKVFDALEEKHVSPAQGIFFEGQIFDAYVFVNDLLRQAKRSIVLIDNFVDDSVLLQLGKRPAGVSAHILTRSITSQLEQDVQRYNAQYPPIVVQEFNLSHDRFLILDGEMVYHIGASLKDLEKKWFAFSRMDKAAFAFMSRVEALISGGDD